MESAPPSPTFELEEGVDFETGKEDTISMQSVQSTQVWLSRMLIHILLFRMVICMLYAHIHSF